MIEQPDGIIITISEAMLKEKGYRNWRKNFMQAMDQRLWAEEAYEKFKDEYEPPPAVGDSSLSKLKQDLWKSKITEYILTEKHKFFNEPVDILKEHFKSQQEYIIAQMVAIRLKGEKDDLKFDFDSIKLPDDPIPPSSSDYVVAMGHAVLSQIDSLMGLPKQKP